MSNQAHYRASVRIDGDAKGLARAAREGQDALKRMGISSAAEYRRMAQARQALGIRSEHEIQREIQRTHAAYNRLARSGVMTWNEQRRAAAAMRQEVTKLTNEMGRYTKAQKLMTAGRGFAGAGVGIGLGVNYLRPKVNAAIDYDTRLAHMANTAFSDRDMHGRKAGMREIDEQVRNAVRIGGGTRDSALETAEALYAAGSLSPEQVKRLLESSVSNATAANADPKEFANLALKARTSLGIDINAADRLFGIGTYAGQKGQFEIRDMAKHLPSQMAFAKQIGLYGEEGFAKLAALNQAAVNTAGSKDEAGTNVKNLMQKIGSKDSEADWKKLGINLPKELAEGRMKGLDGIDVVGNLLAQQLEKDKNYRAVKQQLDASKTDDERQRNLSAVADIAQGTIIGKVFQDQQALGALFAYMNEKDRVRGIASDSLRNSDANQKNMELIRSTPGFQTEQAAQQAVFANQDAFNKLTPVIGGVSEKLAALMAEYPAYAAAIVGTTTSLTALTTAVAGSVGVFAGLGLLLGGRGGGKLGPALPPGATPTGKTASPAGGRLAALGTIGTIASVAAGLFYTDPKEIAILKEAEAKRKAKSLEPVTGPHDASTQSVAARMLADMQAPAARTAAQRMGDLQVTSTGQLDKELRGLIEVRVSGAPGLNVDTSVSTNSPRIPMRAAVGMSMQGSGF